MIDSHFEELEMMAHFLYGEQSLLGQDNFVGFDVNYILFYFFSVTNKRTVSLALKYGQRKNTEHRTVLKILQKLEMLSQVRNLLCVFNWTIVTLLSVLLCSRDGLNQAEPSN